MGRWMAGLVRCWQADPVRRSLNECFAASDAQAWQLTAAALSVLLLSKPVLQEGLLGLALVAGTHAVLAQGVAVLALRHPSMYGRHRELILTVASCHCTCIVIILAIYGSGITDNHNGSPLRLLVLMLINNSAVWTCLYFMYARLTWRWSCLGLPLAALPALLGGGRLCNRMLEAPGVEQPLLGLHWILTLAHSPAVSPIAFLLLTGDEAHPERQCLIINAWLLAVVAVALPLIILRHWEPATHRLLVALWRQRQEQLAAAAGVGLSPAAAAVAASEQAGSRQQGVGFLLTAPDPPAHLGPALLYLGSCLIWMAASVLYRL